MHSQQPIKGFSRLTRDEKIRWLSDYLPDEKLDDFLGQFRIPEEATQGKFESFSENTLSNYHLPWGIVPNVLVDGILYHVPVVIEESSVVAAASKAASFWSQRGGFTTLEISTRKKGQLHFVFQGDKAALASHWTVISARLLKAVGPLTENMEKRGGGITSALLKQIDGLPDNYFQLDLEAETMDSMGANFINTVLEAMGQALPDLINEMAGPGETEIVMAILSNHTPDSMVRMQLEAPISSLHWNKEMAPEKFAEKMKLAADIAWYDTGRAVTHNKGIFNGVDAVVLATGNDFRAVEAAGHAHASRDGMYRSLSRVDIENDTFVMQLEIPLALGTVGGLTRLHPLAAKSLDILRQPDAKTLMKIAAALGMANNFAAMASLVTTGIQQGHMKMHLQNILNTLDAGPTEREKAVQYFGDKTVSVAAVRSFLSSLKPT
ncbi:MAG: hydroxymethylglutaryl-CoA reductase [Bacteroidetes bacterium]|nr:MAG: hydroxymethylglutaryl-CoA reductase [Bacteroidota bacterium]